MPIYSPRAILAFANIMGFPCKLVQIRLSWETAMTATLTHDSAALSAASVTLCLQRLH